MNNTKIIRDTCSWTLSREEWRVHAGVVFEDKETRVSENTLFSVMSVNNKKVIRDTCSWTLNRVEWTDHTGPVSEDKEKPG